MTMLRVEGVSLAFGGLQALDAVTLTVPEQSIYGVIGPNGAGKTTLFNVISGVYAPDAGRVLFRGGAISGLRPHQIAARGVARTFQNLRLFETLSVRENVLAPLAGHHGLGEVLSVRRMWGRVDADRASLRRCDQIIESVGLGAYRAARAGDLPHGYKRRLELARALVLEPRLVLLDEPSAGLTSGEIEGFLGLVREIRERGPTILIIEHNMSVVMGLSDSVAVLNHGRKIADGAPENVSRNPDVVEAYLGRQE